jgi:hypothetical protein
VSGAAALPLVFIPEFPPGLLPGLLFTAVAVLPLDLLAFVTALPHFAGLRATGLISLVCPIRVVLVPVSIPIAILIPIFALIVLAVTVPVVVSVSIFLMLVSAVDVDL